MVTERDGYSSVILSVTSSNCLLAVVQTCDGGGRLGAEEAADVTAMPGRLADIDVVGGGVGPLVLAAPHLDVEGRPPLPIVGGRTFVAEPALAGGEVVELELRMERGERAFEVVGVLGLEMAADQGQQVGVHGEGSRATFEFL